MAFDTTILEEKIEKLKDAYNNGQFADALVGALNTGNGLMQQRIFTENQDVQGNDFGKYIGKTSKARLIPSANALQNKRNQALAGLQITSYQRKRAKAGRQIDKKDLEFSGGLRRSIETVVENERAAVLEFNNSDAALIAKGQEAQIANIRLGQKATTKGIGIKIFRLNEAEKKEVNVQGRELINQVMKR